LIFENNKIENNKNENNKNENNYSLNFIFQTPSQNKKFGPPMFF